jgi:2-phospho-L-lactate guanylyltransferase
VPAAILIPVSPFEEGKSRLAPVLSKAQRAALGERFFRHVLSIAVRAVPDGHCFVISRSAAVLGLASRDGAQGVLERQRGLNEALMQGATVARTQGATGLLVLSSDLPLLGREDLDAMLALCAQASAVIAPDAGDTGTNALWLSPPGLIPYAFGEGSFARHRRALEDAGHQAQVIRRRGLACDVDSPEDLERLRADGWT